MMTIKPQMLFAPGPVATLKCCMDVNASSSTIMTLTGPTLDKEEAMVCIYLHICSAQTIAFLPSKMFPRLLSASLILEIPTLVLKNLSLLVFQLCLFYTLLITWIRCVQSIKSRTPPLRKSR